MAQGRKGKLNYRCPLCFMREIDMDMLYDQSKEEYYCLRCSFAGSEGEVLMLNQRARYRFKDRAIRITEFNLPRRRKSTKVSVGRGTIQKIPIKEQQMPTRLTKPVVKKDVLRKSVQTASEE